MDLNVATPPVQRFSINPQGRDLVVGDLHGCFALLEAALERLDFDPTVDRLFSVGDLIDRGPESYRAAEFLVHPWFHPVRGNHEMLMLDAIRSGDPDAVVQWVGNGGNWWYPDHEKLLLPLAELIDRMPWAIEVATPQGTVGIVHADAPEDQDWASFTQELEHDTVGHIHDFAVWSRKRFAGRVQQAVAGIHRVVVGHSITTTPFRRDNVIFLDTGAYLEYRDNTRGGLTVLNLHTWEFRTFHLGHHGNSVEDTTDSEALRGNG